MTATQTENAADLGLTVEVTQALPIRLAARFSCRAGELLALVGPSGSGKTSLLRCIAGLQRPNGGHISCMGQLWFDGITGLHLDPQERRVGMVFQHYALFPHLNALENVTIAMPTRDRALRRDAAMDLLEAVHLTGLERHWPRELSGGQRQRVALARALAREPAVLLLDEPFSAVDQVTRRKLQRELASLRKRINLPIVLVTHDLQEARMLADRMCLLHRGTTLQTGPPSEVMSRPVSALAARLVDVTNVFAGTIERHDAVAGITEISWGNYRILGPYSPQFEIASPVSWLIPPEYIILHRRDRPSQGEHENPLPLLVEESIQLGESTAITARVDSAGGTQLSFSIPTHVTNRAAIAPGLRVQVSLLQAGIHLMPADTNVLEP